MITLTITFPEWLLWILVPAVAVVSAYYTAKLVREIADIKKGRF